MQPSYLDGWFQRLGLRQEVQKRRHTYSGTAILDIACTFPKDARLDWLRSCFNGKLTGFSIQTIRISNGRVGGGSPNSGIKNAWLENSDPNAVEREGKRAKCNAIFFTTAPKLGYQVMHSVYLPSGYNANQNTRWFTLPMVTNIFMNAWAAGRGASITSLPIKNPACRSSVCRSPWTGKPLEQQADDRVSQWIQNTWVSSLDEFVPSSSRPIPAEPKQRAIWNFHGRD